MVLLADLHWLTWILSKPCSTCRGKSSRTAAIETEKISPKRFIDPDLLVTIRIGFPQKREEGAVWVAEAPSIGPDISKLKSQVSAND